MTLTALSFLFPPKPSQEVKIWARAGEQIELQVLFPQKNLLLNREAPNTLTLLTPWGKTTLKPNGKPHKSSKFQAYFGQVHPMKLKIKVPSKITLGKHQGQLKGQFFACELQDRQCTKRILKTKVHIQVVKKKRKALHTLQLQHHDLKPMQLRPLKAQP